MHKFRSSRILGSICMQVWPDIELYLYISGFPMSTKMIMLYMGIQFGGIWLDETARSLVRINCIICQMQVRPDSSLAGFLMRPGLVFSYIWDDNFQHM